MLLNPDLVAILRCPACVSGETRRLGDDPGRLTLIKDDTWFVCLEEGCHRKYPIRENIPVMLVDEGDQWVDTAVEDLPKPGKLV